MWVGYNYNDFLFLFMSIESSLPPIIKTGMNGSSVGIVGCPITSGGTGKVDSILSPTLNGDPQVLALSYVGRYGQFCDDCSIKQLGLCIPSLDGIVEGRQTVTAEIPKSWNRGERLRNEISELAGRLLQRLGHTHRIIVSFKQELDITDADRGRTPRDIDGYPVEVL